MEKIQEKIRNYWEDESTISIIDTNLHALEIQTVSKYLEPKDRLADVGCGNASATVQYAPRVQHATAIERSSHLRTLASEAIAKSGCNNIDLVDGDVLKLGQGDQKFDAVVSQRMLINMSSWEEQMQAIENLRSVLRPGGRLILVENTNDGMLALNEMRHMVGLPPIPQHWHNRFFDYKQFMSFMQGGFQLLKEHDFSLYYFLTRVYVPMFSEFVGYGANAKKDPLFIKSDPAARKLYDLFSKQIKFDSCRVLGPIQCFVFRKDGLGS